MKNCTVYSSLATASQCRQHCSIEPASELVTPFFFFNLFVILKVIADNKTWSHAPPFTATHFLAGASGEDSELVSVFELGNDFCLGVGDEAFDFEVID